MPNSEQFLLEAGATILQEIRVRQPLFLVEVEPATLRPEIIISQLGRIAKWGWRSEYKAAAAWAAVQLASRSDADEVEDEGGFRRLFFRHLGREFSPSDWDEIFGHHIRHFLETAFPAVELPEPGPWHLVGAVYRHAGIPATSKTSYAQFVAKMLRGELSFSFDEYQYNMRQLLPSPVVRQFLESRLGYEFTRDLARQVARVYQGDFVADALPAWSAQLIHAVVTLLRESTIGSRKLKVPKGFSRPFLCLDIESYSLKIVFDSRGVRERYYWITARPVLYPSQPVRESEPPQFRSGITTIAEQVHPWWTPSDGGWALFRVDDGALITSSSSQIQISVAVGDYYLVTDEPSHIPEHFIKESQVALDVGNLDEPVWDYWVVRVSLTPKAEIPALQLRVDGDVPLPQLEWIRPSSLASTWGSNVFGNHLPGVRLSPWSSASADGFSVTVEDGKGEREVDVPSNGELCELSLSCPASGYVALRRRGIGREVVGRLTFGVVPDNCRLCIPPEILRTDETAQIVAELPPNATIQWVSGVQDNFIGAHERRLEGILKFDSCSVAFSRRVPRAGVVIELDGKQQPVLWKEHCDREYKVRLELPAGTTSTLLVSEGEMLDELLNQPSHPRASVQSVPLTNFRDAIVSYPHSFGELILRLRTRTREALDINTGCFLACAEKIAKEFMTQPLDSTMFHIPRLGSVLIEYRDLVMRPAAKCLPVPEETTPAVLKEHLARLRLIAGALDGQNEGKVEFSPGGDTSTPDVLIKWLLEAQRHARSGLTDAGISAPPPYELIEALPVHRWKETISNLITELGQNANLPLLIAEFRNSFEDGSSPERVELCGRRGGVDLWYAVNSYHLSMRSPGASERDLVGQLRRFEAILSGFDNDPVVKFLAQAFRFMNYYRLNRRAMLDTSLFSNWPPMLAPLRCTLTALKARAEGTQTQIAWPELGVGLGDISPFVHDTDLERDLRQQPTTGS